MIALSWNFLFYALKAGMLMVLPCSPNLIKNSTVFTISEYLFWFEAIQLEQGRHVAKPDVRLVNRFPGNASSFGPHLYCEISDIFRRFMRLLSLSPSECDTVFTLVARIPSTFFGEVVHMVRSVIISIRLANRPAVYCRGRFHWR